ncbi:MAG TPA: DUF1287 domain-containing protein [Erysipelotrichaceae bacterium]|nr:DUF1287 domain-containing protein [Erysipelotrichaceae bacterium]
MIKTTRRRKKVKWIVPASIITLSVIGLSVAIYAYSQNREPVPVIEEVVEQPVVLSKLDRLILGARKDALAMPAYVNAYYAGGYPPENEGTCTDLVWRAFMEADILLKDLVDEDIKTNRERYDHIAYRDPNIDFRRVQNLAIFFEYNAEVLTTDVYDTQAWQAGDIVVFGNYEHIGIVSDIRNANDIPYLIHNNDQPVREEDRLEYGSYTMGIKAHYRYSLNP